VTPDRNSQNISAPVPLLYKAQNLLYLLKAADAALGGNTGFAEAVVWLWLYILALYNGLLQWLYIAALYSGPL